jgi:hypothetical protein
LPIAKEIVTGLQRFGTKTSEGVKTVDLPERREVLTRPGPCDADRTSARSRASRRSGVVAFGPTGRSVGGTVHRQRGREVFKGRIADAGEGLAVSGPTRSLAAVAVPEGKSLQKLEFYSNEARVATLYQAPYNKP